MKRLESMRIAPILASSRTVNAGLASEPEEITALKWRLLIAAVEKPPCFRADSDLVIVVQYLAGLEAMAGMSPHALHYLASEAILLRLADGDILCYQEDPIKPDSSALVVIEGSLCGYFNKAFSQRTATEENFQTWNAKQVKRRGMLVDFGELQTTYSSGALCCSENLVSPSFASTGSASRGPYCRRNGIYAQESTLAIEFRKDTLDRAAAYFHLHYDKGFLQTKEHPLSDLKHASMLNLLSDQARQKLFDTAPHRELKVGELVYPLQNDELADGASCCLVNAFVIVVCGRIDIYWVDEPTEPSRPTQASNRTSEIKAETARAKVELSTQLKHTPLAFLRRGQTFGDHTLGLAHDKPWIPQRFLNASLRLVAADVATEVIMIHTSLFEEYLREDHLRLSYKPFFSCSTNIEEDIQHWVLRFFSKKTAEDREHKDISKLAQHLLSDGPLGRFFFQLPPLVIERLCHTMELIHCESSGIMFATGDTLPGLLVVVHGQLQVSPPQVEQIEAFSSADIGPIRIRRTASSASVTTSTNCSRPIQTYLPGDAFGASKLKERQSISVNVHADCDTVLLCIPKAEFERWLLPMHEEIIFNPGSIIQRLFPSPGGVRLNIHASKISQTQKRRVSTLCNSSNTASIGNERSTVSSNQDHGTDLDDIAILLKKLGIFRTIPRFVLGSLLKHGHMIDALAGEVLFLEGANAKKLVVILSGFLSFYSLQYISSTVEMFQHHTFCQFTSFRSSQKNPETVLVDEISCHRHSVGHRRNSIAARHRAATMHGVHVQTLPRYNQFRTGVLHDSSVCPATVIAQTNCQYFVIDESEYTLTLQTHPPAINLSQFMNAATRVSHSQVVANRDNTEAPAPERSIRQRRASLANIMLIKHLQQTQINWLSKSSAKRELMIRSMRHMAVAPGERIIRCHDLTTHLLIVVSGTLLLYVHQNPDAFSFLNASQRSVRSLMLERSVASNYSTTSQQLYRQDYGTPVAAKEHFRTRLSRIADQSSIMQHHTARRKGAFIDSVMAAVHVNKLRQAPQAPQLSSVNTSSQNPKSSPSKENEGTERQVTGLLLRAAVSKAKLQQKLQPEDWPKPVKLPSRRHGSMHEGGISLFLCQLSAGDVYGDEFLTSHAKTRSIHDISVEASGAPASSINAASTTGAQLLILDRQVFLSINAKTEEEAAKELNVRCSFARNKWLLAEQKIAQALNQTGNSSTRRSSTNTPTLFQLFRNIVNQRYYITMRTIAEIPLLRDIPDASKRDLCQAARLEALDKFSNVYQSNGAGSNHRYYLVLSGSVGLYTKMSSNGAFLTHGTGNNSLPLSSVNSMGGENCLREVQTGEGFGEFEILRPGIGRNGVHAIAHEPTKVISFPSDVFLSHWPNVEQMKTRIEYLRERVHYFSKLEVEKIAYLYHSIAFETFGRPSKIFEQQHSGPSQNKLYIVTEGTCSIVQQILLESEKQPLADSDAIVNPLRRTNNERKRHRVNVQATIVDVSVGHICWIEGVFPFTLQVVSALATVAIIAIHKVQAVLPKTQLAALEAASEQMDKLYRRQYQTAKQLVIAAMEEKREVEQGNVSKPTFLPSLKPPKSSMPARGEAASHDLIPFSRLLAAKPVDLISIQHSRDFALPQHSEQDEWPDSVGRIISKALLQDVNTRYRQEHQLEHYDVDRHLQNPMLLGSFPENPVLRRRRISKPPPTGSLVAVPESNGERTTSEPSSKMDEYMAPEDVHPSSMTPSSHYLQQQSNAKNTFHLEVTVPVIPDAQSGTRKRAKTPENTICPRRPSSNTKLLSFTRVRNARGQVGDGDYGWDFEVDLRVVLRVQLSATSAPLRSIRLEKSQCKVNSLGKYYDSPSIPSRRLVALVDDSPVTPHQKLPTSSPARRRLAIPNSPMKPSPQLPTQGAIRKQGFLVVSRLPSGLNSCSPQVLADRASSGRRRFLMLVQNVLAEYSDTVVLTQLSPSACQARYELDATASSSCVQTVLASGLASEAHTLLSHSFMLAVDVSTQLLLTAPSATEKKMWMTELQHACVMGPQRLSLHHKVRPPASKAGATESERVRISRERRTSALNNPLEELTELVIEYLLD